MRGKNKENKWRRVEERKRGRMNAAKRARKRKNGYSREKKKREMGT